VTISKESHLLGARPTFDTSKPETLNAFNTLRNLQLCRAGYRLSKATPIRAANASATHSPMPMQEVLRSVGARGRRQLDLICRELACRCARGDPSVVLNVWE
jgi:hypothetical protein